jgi:hypothetical protein
VEILLADYFVGEQCHRQTHVFESVEGRVEIEVFDVGRHETGS